MKGRLRTDQLGKKETVATAEGVWLVVAVGTGRTIGRVRRTGSVIAQASAAVLSGFVLSGKSIDDFLYYLPQRVVIFGKIATLPNNRLDADARKTRAAYPAR
jgi:hypothetical protein